MQIEHSHTITLPVPVENALPFLSPLSGHPWIEPGEATFLAPTEGGMREGLVFRTGSGADETLWCCTLWNPAALTARYARFKQGLCCGLVDLVCKPILGCQTRVTVTHTLTALGPEGEAFLRDFTEEAFREMLENWYDRLAAGSTDSTPAAA